MSKRPKRTKFYRKMLCFQQWTQLNLVIAVENTPTRASAFNLSDPAVVVNERAVTSRHRNEEYSSNPHPVSGSSVQCRWREGGGIVQSAAGSALSNEYNFKQSNCVWRQTPS